MTIFLKLLPVILFYCIFPSHFVWAEAFPYSLCSAEIKAPTENTVLGFEQTHIVKEKETLLDIARQYGLGFNELSNLYPEMDPWVPVVGQKIDIPTTWVLPSTKFEEVVINVPEMRLYHFIKSIGLAKTYPIGIGRDGLETPVGEFKVVVKEKNPTWVVPPSARENYPQEVYPPGPDNPLGEFWVGLSAPHIGIHGTNFPWAVGRQASRGCIRLYPEHIGSFFEEVKIGAKVEIIYEPIKVGIRDGIIYLEVHPDLYAMIPDTYNFTENLLQHKGLWDKIDVKLLTKCLKEQSGVPVAIGETSKGGDADKYYFDHIANGSVSPITIINNIY